METNKSNLLAKYDLTLESLSYSFIEKCDNTKTLEKIVRVLRSGEEGTFPHLLSCAEEKLRALKPTSRVLRSTEPVLTSKSLDHHSRKELTDGLKKFTAEMKMQEDNLHSTVAKKSNLPAVRTSQKKTLGEIKLHQGEALKSAVPRDYSEWDKFDVDRELKKMEVEEEREREAAVMLIRNKEKNLENRLKEVSPMFQQDILCGMSEQEKQYAEAREKQKGNECFKAGEYVDALCHYTRCLQLRESPDVYNNRAMAYLKLERYSEAIKDCDTVLTMDPDNAKAYYRRSSAYQKLSNFIQARDDMARVLELQPDLQTAKTVLRDLEKQCAQPKSRRIPITDVVSENFGCTGQTAETRRNENLVLRNISVGNVKRDSNGLKKRNISSHPKIVELPDVENANVRTTDCEKNSGMKSAVTEQTARSIPDRKHSDSVGTQDGENNNVRDAWLKHQKQASQQSRQCEVCMMEGRSPSYACQWLHTPPKTPAKCRKTITGKFNSNGVRKYNSSIITGKGDGERITNLSAMPDDETVNVKQCFSTGNVHTAGDGNGNFLGNTTSPYNFVKIWQQMQDENSHLVGHAHLLKNLNPSELPNVLGNKLDGQMLGMFLTCLDQHFDVEENGRLIADYLYNLSRVQRFGTVFMLLDHKERAVAHRLLCGLKDAGVPVGSLESAFQLVTAPED
ncbi:sperm-associated antigen 1 [Bacillus rossius redtenbacheri]|uniref:sperm-associated antigen 1 n=1 Tax=Bacillus rossius redtenbacheri TaxID=93214 RepID=UPI002FDD6D10